MAKKKKKPIHGPDKTFIMYPSVKPGRGGILRTVRRLMGPGTYNQSFQLRMSREDQLARFTSARIDVTVSKLMNAIALCYVQGVTSPALMVEGARLQHGQGDSRYVKSGGVTYLAGTEAAHFAIGTLTRGGRSASQVAYWQLHHNALSKGIALKDIHQMCTNYALLVASGYAHDASTYLAPAFINQVDGKLETQKQQLMRDLMPTHLPSNPDQLESQLITLSNRLVYRLVEHSAVAIRPIEMRLKSLSNGNGTEILQYPKDTENTLYGGQESEYLVVLKDLHQNPNSELHHHVQRIVSDIPREAGEIMEAAEVAKQEKEEITS